MRVLPVLALVLLLAPGLASAQESLQLGAGHREVGDGDCDKADTYYSDSWFAAAGAPTSAGMAGGGVEYQCYRYDRYDGYKAGATFWRAWLGLGGVGTSVGWYAYDEPPRAHCQTLLVTPVSGPHDLGCFFGKPPRMPYMPERGEDPREWLP